MAQLTLHHLRATSSEDERPELLDLMFPEKLKVVRFVAVSAYYDVETIRKIRKLVHTTRNSRHKCDLIIILDRTNVKREENDLKKIDDKICRDDRYSARSGIYVADFGKLFHCKGYLCESEHRGIFSLGSLNLTQPALKKNEELMLSIRYSRSNSSGKTHQEKIADDFRNYALKLLEEKNVRRYGIYVSEIDHTKYDEFLLNGSLWYELQRPQPFQFSLELDDSLRDSLRKVLVSSIDPESENADVLEVIGSYNLLESIDVTKSSDSSGENGRSNWKSYCVETCFGYWAPFAWENRIKEELKFERNLRHYKKISKNIKNTADEKFVEDIFSKAEAIHRLLKNSDEISRKNKQWRYMRSSGSFDSDRLRKDIKRRLQSLRKQINRKEYLKRLSSPIHSVPVPDLTHNPDLWKEFERSFFDSLKFWWGVKGTKKRIVRCIRKELEVSGGSTVNPNRAKEFKEFVKTKLIDAVAEED